MARPDVVNDFEMWAAISSKLIGKSDEESLRLLERLDLAEVWKNANDAWAKALAQDIVDMRLDRAQRYAEICAEVLSRHTDGDGLDLSMSDDLSRQTTMRMRARAVSGGVPSASTTPRSADHDRYRDTPDSDLEDTQPKDPRRTAASSTAPPAAPTSEPAGADDAGRVESANASSSESSVADSAATGAAATEAAATESAATESAATEAAATESAATESAATESAPTDAQASASDGPVGPLGVSTVKTFIDTLTPSTQVRRPQRQQASTYDAPRSFELPTLLTEPTVTEPTVTEPTVTDPEVAEPTDESAKTSRIDLTQVKLPSPDDDKDENG